MKFKKGEMSTQQIIFFIILITSFIVVLFFLFRLDLGGQSEGQICHDSVLRSSSTLSTTYLKCSREYVCITKDKTCEGMPSPDKVLKVKNMDELYGALSDRMANCWWKFGEGKISYKPDELTRKNYCSICDEILFDDSLKEISDGDQGDLNLMKEGKISKDSLYYYLTKHNISKEQTYAEYLLGTNDLNSIKVSLSSQGQGSASFGELDFNNQEHFWLVMGIVTDISTWKWVAVGGALAIPTVVLGGGIGVAVLVGAGGGALGGTVATQISESFNPNILAINRLGDGVDNVFMTPTLDRADKTEFDKFGCEDIETFN